MTVNIIRIAYIYMLTVLAVQRRQATLTGIIRQYGSDIG